MPHKVRYAESARADLKAIAGWITVDAGVSVALGYIDRIEAACETLTDFPRRGRLRRRTPEIRSIPFERQATMLYRVNRNEILVLGIIHAGRDAERDLNMPR